MKNAAQMALHFASLLPPHMRPEYTQGYEGFYHLTSISAREEKAKLEYIIREHDGKKFALMKKRMKNIENLLNEEYGAGVFQVTITDSYQNMKEVLINHKEIVEKAIRAMKTNGIEPIVTPIRGGTDGSRLSFMGLPCPNVSTGGYNFHSRQECISVQAMDQMVEVLLTIVKQG
ncbi:MAG: M20/M25/M40 family metallo-hydrolase [Clostridiales bacterium]|nr:M20/M25/M40 family metallo-hydrolase [Clostridiales bacterium]